MSFRGSDGTHRRRVGKIVWGSYPRGQGASTILPTRIFPALRLAHPTFLRTFTAFAQCRTPPRRIADRLRKVEGQRRCATGAMFRAKAPASAAPLADGRIRSRYFLQSPWRYARDARWRAGTAGALGQT